jgi:hypothetical protein
MNPQVILCGENPEIQLMRPGIETMVALASYWRCTYTPIGVGQVLIIHLEPDADRAAFTAIYADNIELGRYVVDELVQHFDYVTHVRFGEVPVEEAHISQSGDSVHEYRVVCDAGSTTIDLLWRDVLEFRLPRTYPDLITLPDAILDVSNVICPTAIGSIVINRVAVDGNVHSYHDGERHRSSAFLAFSETWVRRAASQ